MNSSKMFLAFCAAWGALSSAAHAGEAAPPPAFISCDGGAHEAAFTNTLNGQVTKAGASWAMIPSTQVPGGISGTGSDSDLYTVTFSGQSNNSVAGTSWLAQAEVSVDGDPFVPLFPIGPNTFHSGSVADTHAMTWCSRLVANASTQFRIMWWKVGAGNAIADDFTVQVKRFD